MNATSNTNSPRPNPMWVEILMHRIHMLGLEARHHVVATPDQPDWVTMSKWQHSYFKIIHIVEECELYIFVELFDGTPVFRYTDTLDGEFKFQQKFTIINMPWTQSFFASFTEK